MKFADLHCHPVGRLMMEKSVLNPRKFSKKNSHPFNIPKSKIRSMAKGNRAGKYTQSDFPKLLAGNVKLVFAALYPLEQGIVCSQKQNKLGRLKYKPHFDAEEILIAKDEIEYFESRLIEDEEGNFILPEEEQKEFEANKRFPAIAYELIMGIPRAKVNQVCSEAYNYWEELKKEYQFLKRKSGSREGGEILMDLNDDGKIKRSEKKSWEGEYRLLAKNVASEIDPVFGKQTYVLFSEIDEAKQEEDLVIVVPTIEGINTITMENVLNITDEKTVFERIKEVKNWDPGVFFITLAHHFNNNVCAHAHSLPKIAGNQKLNMNYLKGFGKKTGINELGYRIIEELLEIEKVNGSYVDRENTDQRILIDVKHMSASSRKNYYEQVVKPYNDNPDNAKKIPVIASHVAYSGKKKLQEHIDNYSNENNKFDTFNDWNINVCDEDVAEILKSEGLIGISFDQRILGDKGADIHILKNMKQKELKIIAFFNSFVAILHAAKETDKYVFDPNEYTVWDALCIGTDNDGFIDPIDDHTTAADFPEFGLDFEKHLTAWNERKDFGIDTPEKIQQVMEKFTFKNAYNFLVKHY